MRRTLNSARSGAIDAAADTSNIEARTANGQMPMWAASLALFCLLLLIFAPGFTMDYLTLDEVAFVGRKAESYDFRYYALSHGRPLSFYRPFVYAFAKNNAARIQFVRFVCFACLAAVAIVVFRLLSRASGRPFFSFFVTLFFFSQLPFQAISGFSLDLISAVLPPIFLSLAAFWLHFYFLPRKSVRRWLANLVVLALLLAAMQSAQSWAFFAMVPLAFLVLAGTRERVGQARVFLLLALASIAISLVTYRIGLEALYAEGRQGYRTGEKIMARMTRAPLVTVRHAINPERYWSAYKLWNYPYPLHNARPSPRRKKMLAVTTMIIWLLLVAGALMTELRARAADKKLVATKWLSAGVCLGFGALVLLAAEPIFTIDYRPHLTLVMTGVIIFIGAHALLVLSARFRLLRTPAARAVGVALVLMTAFGAQTGLLRGYVDPRGDQLDFIRTELSARPPEEFDRVVVIFAPRDSGCVSEPCDEFSGQIIHRIWYARRPERYRYAMTTLGIPPMTKEILFVDEYSENRDRDLVIDWTKFYKARREYARVLRL